MTEEPARRTVTDTDRLTASPGQILKHPHTGADYYSGEQIITHLNYSLGPMNWDWEPLEHGFDQDADEVWVLGKLTARFVVDAMNDDGYEMRPTFKIERGWQPVNRKRTGDALSIGNDYKGADTDALKRCARLLGVGLDAWSKDDRGPTAEAPKPKAPSKPAASGPARPANEPTSIDRTRAAAMVTGAAPPSGLTCNVCEAELHEVRFKDGTVWQPADLAKFGQLKHSRVLCMNHYREANQAKREAEEALQKIT